MYLGVYLICCFGVYLYLPSGDLESIASLASVPALILIGIISIAIDVKQGRVPQICAHCSIQNVPLHSYHNGDIERTTVDGVETWLLCTECLCKQIAKDLETYSGPVAFLDPVDEGYYTCTRIETALKNTRENIYKKSDMYDLTQALHSLNKETCKQCQKKAQVLSMEKYDDLNIFDEQFSQKLSNKDQLSYECREHALERFKEYMITKNITFLHFWPQRHSEPSFFSMQ